MGTGMWFGVRVEEGVVWARRGGGRGCGKEDVGLGGDNDGLGRYTGGQ